MGGGGGGSKTENVIFYQHAETIFFFNECILVLLQYLSLNNEELSWIKS